MLSELNKRHNYGLDLFLLSVDEGITGYRDDSLETVKRNELQVTCLKMTNVGAHDSVMVVGAHFFTCASFVVRLAAQSCLLQGFVWLDYGRDSKDDRVEKQLHLLWSF